MDFTSLQKYGFKEWYRLTDIIKGIVEVPITPATYALRLDHKFGRLRGSSDLLYIGSTSNLHFRIIENYLGGRGDKTTKRIRDYLFNKGYLEATEVSWIITQNYEKIESKLLAEYEKEHHELPPWNRARS